MTIVKRSFRAKMSSSILAVAIRDQDFADDLGRKLAQARQAENGANQFDSVERYGPLGDVGSVVTDALDVGRNAQAGEDLAQVARHRATQGQVHHVMADLVLDGVDGLVVGDDALRGLVVPAFDHVQRGFQLGHGGFAHAHDLGHDAALFFVVTLHDMVVRLGVHGRPQPKRPVM